MKMVHQAFDRKEVFILLLGHLGSAGIGVNLKATCQAVLKIWPTIMLGVNDLLCSFPSVEALNWGTNSGTD